jgi:putative transposase
MEPEELENAVGLFRRVAPTSYWLRLSRQSRFQRRGIFSLAVVVWMMIEQRLGSQGTLAAAVARLREDGCRGLLRRCKRVREGRISASTGGYCQARQKLSILTVKQIMDDVFERLQTVLREGWLGLGKPIFLLDGTTLLLQHGDDLVRSYPPASNQRGASHWPTVRMVVAHDVESGVAVRPAWGPANGAKATSEQKLIEDVLARLPADSIVMGDRNFGVFSVAWSAQQNRHGVVLRLNNAIARRLLGGRLEAGVERAVLWRPSPYELPKHPEIPAAASLSGRVIICPLQGAREPLLCLFTTLENPAAEVAQIYTLRWNIETDLRALKRTVQLHHIHARSVAMTEKELLIAILAYNLVRTVMCLAARKAGLHPRQLSFTSVYCLIEIHLPSLLNARSHRQWRREMDTVVSYAADYKLPQRKKKRSFPRAVWGAGYRFPSKTHAEN